MGASRGHGSFPKCQRAGARKRGCRHQSTGGLVGGGERAAPHSTGNRPPLPHRPINVDQPQSWGHPALRTAGSRAAPRPQPGEQGTSSVQLLSCARLFADPVDCNTPGFPVHPQLLELAQAPVHPAGEAIQVFHPLSSLLLQPSIFPSIRGFSNESVLHIGWPKYWSFSRGPEPSCFLTCSQTIPNPPTPRRNTSRPPGIGVKGHLMNFQSCSLFYHPPTKCCLSLQGRAHPLGRQCSEPFNSYQFQVGRSIVSNSL